MGVWSSPLDSVNKAIKLEEKMQQPWIITIDSDGTKVLADAYELIGDDGFFDYIADTEAGTDMRAPAISYIKKYLKEINTFFRVDPDAVKILKKLVKNWNS